MKLSLLGGTALLAAMAMAGAAQAADVTDTAYDWSGVYAGFNAGAVFDNSDTSSTASGSAPWIDTAKAWDDPSPTGFTAGGMLGYNWQVDQVVLGVETDLNYGYLKGAGGTEFDYELTGVGYDLDWYGTLRGRAGYAAGNLLFYGTAGLAYGGMDTTFVAGIFDYTQKSDVSFGWTAGGGVEYGIGKWSVGAEYLYVDLGEQDASQSGEDIDGNDYKIRNSVDYQFSVARATVKYRF